MYSITIDKATIPAELIPGVEAVNERLIVTLRKLSVAFDVSARWHGGSVQGVQKVFLDLVAVHKGREYPAKDYAYPESDFRDTNQTQLPDLHDQHGVFGRELRRLIMDDLKEQIARTEATMLVGVEL